MHGLHYSRGPIAVGTTITSVQSQERLYQRVHNIYKHVAYSRGFYFPEEYGYAYPLSLPRKAFKHAHRVTADAHYVTTGNLNHSLYVTIARARDFLDRRLPLGEREAKQDEAFKNEAMMYFLKPSGFAIELISDRWIVEEIL